MRRNVNPMKRRKDDSEEFSLSVAAGDEGRKKSLTRKILSSDEEIQVISDDPTNIFSFSSLSKKAPPTNQTNRNNSSFFQMIYHIMNSKKISIKSGVRSASLFPSDLSESDPKKPKLTPKSAAAATAQRSLLVTASRNSSIVTKPTTNEKENIKSSSGGDGNGKRVPATALNPPGTAPRRLTSQLAGIFMPSDKPKDTTKKSERNFNKVELASKYAAKKQAERDAKYGSTPSAKYLDNETTSYEGFRMANGSKDIIKEMKSITPVAVKKPETPQSKSQTPASKTIPESEEQKEKPQIPEDPNSLKNHASLKHFEQHIIEHIESEILTSNNNVTWDAVAGLEQAKKTLREIVVFPFLRPDLFKGLRAPSKGVLLFGPPGTGKTLIAGCVANQARATFFNVSVSTVMSKWVGEGEKVVRALFQIARLKLPSIIFIDEIDALLSARKDGDHESSRRVKTEFLIQMDGIATNSDERLLVLGATNKPEDIDEAARRRFPKRLYIALPDFEARKGMIQRHMNTNCNELKDTDYNELATMTDGFSGADMFHFAKEAAYGPLRDVINDIEKIPEDKIRPIKFDDFLNVLPTVKPTVLESELESYLEWDKKFGCHS
uniref:AAA+ ATPase domain-containing protein n=1 Tax=Panagrolaimus superbus TaxID=310955 RepID=A0A914YY50_9BILA